MSEDYSKKQFQLGLEYYRKEDFKKSIKIFEKIKRKDSPEMFAAVQFSIGFYYIQLENPIEAINAWENQTT